MLKKNGISYNRKEIWDNKQIIIPTFVIFLPNTSSYLRSSVTCLKSGQGHPFFALIVPATFIHLPLNPFPFRWNSLISSEHPFRAISRKLVHFQGPRVTPSNTNIMKFTWKCHCRNNIFIFGICPIFNLIASSCVKLTLHVC